MLMRLLKALGILVGMVTIVLEQRGIRQERHVKSVKIELAVHILPVDNSKHQP